jgi:xanthine dehydrogenase molybdenum-binding subunit
VAAETLDIAEEALGLIDVDYEELPVVLDALEAMKPETPPIHSNKGAPEAPRGRPGGAGPAGNIPLRMEFSRGDIEVGFKEADVVLENTYRTQKVHHGYAETRSAVADIDSNGNLTIWSDNSSIFNTREMVAGFLKMPLNRIRVVPVEVGGTFGGKGRQPLSPLCAILAQKTGRPVKIAMTRAEDMQANYPPPSTIITLKMGVTRDGRLTAVSGEFIYDCGAYLGVAPASIIGGVSGLSYYRIPHLKARCYDVLTNKSHTGFYRAPSAPQSVFAVESHMDLLARAINMDPLDFRLKNAVREGDPGLSNEPFPRIGFVETLERMREHLSHKAKPEGAGQGRGIACGYFGGDVGSSAAHINVNSDGTVMLVVGSTDVSGNRTTLAQMAAEELEIAFSAVTVVQGDTITAPYADVSSGSRTTHQMGTAVCRACQDIKEQLLQRASRRLNIPLQDLEYHQGRVLVKGAPDKSVSLAELALDSIGRGKEGPLTGSGIVGSPAHVPMFAVHAVDLAVDKETGKVKVLSYAAAQDVGRAINPALVEGQIQGAVAQGIGWALFEACVFNTKGVIQNTNMLDYRMPTPADLPFIETLIVEVNSVTAPFGVRGVGEPPIVPSLAALANAVHSASGVRLKELPLTPESIFRAMQENQSRT